MWKIDENEEALLLVAGGGAAGEHGRAPTNDKDLNLCGVNFGKNGVQQFYPQSPKNVYCAGAGLENTRKRGLRDGNKAAQEKASNLFFKEKHKKEHRVFGTAKMKFI